jgi:ATP-dependent exoDNAse (exonuclease V) beta subunit
MPILTANGEPLRLSVSKIKDAETCMRMFKLKHIDLAQPEEPAKYLNFGTTMHDVFELLHTGAIPPPRAKAFEWLDKYWLTKEQEIRMLKEKLESWQVLCYDSVKDEVEYKELGRQIIDSYYDNVIDKGLYRPSKYAEIYFRLPLMFDYEISGRIDRIVETDSGKLQIVDWKTSKNRESEDRLEEDVQLAVYWWAAKQILDLTDDDIESAGLYYLRYNDFRAVTLDQFTIGAIMFRIEKIIDDIEHHRFPKTRSWKCRYCDVAQDCANYDAA